MTLHVSLEFVIAAAFTLVALGFFLHILLQAVSESRGGQVRRDAKAMREHANALKHWPPGYGTDEQWDAMEAQMEARHG